MTLDLYRTNDKSSHQNEKYGNSTKHSFLHKFSLGKLF